MGERRNERAGRGRSARSSRTRPVAPSRPSGSRRGRNPAPQPSSGPITDAISLDLVDDASSAPFDDAVTTVIGRVDIDIAGEETSSDDTGVGDVGAGETSTASGRRGLVRVPARALAARWQGLNPRRAIVLAVVVGFVALTLAVPIRTYFSQRAELDQIRASNAAIEQESAELTRKVNEQGDPAYVEAQARARLQYVRPGETPFVLEIPGRERTAQEERRAAERAANPWFANLWDSVATPPPAK